jgi:phosphate transport system permease protein
MVWLTGGALVLSLIMVIGLLLLVFVQGVANFWPGPVIRIETADGAILMGEINRTEEDPSKTKGITTRRMVRTGNFDVSGTHFKWVDDDVVSKETEPEWCALFERVSWGRFYGFPAEFRIDDEVVASEPEAVWVAFEKVHKDVRGRFEERRSLEEHEIGALNARLEQARLEQREALLDHGENSPEYARATRNMERVNRRTDAELLGISRKIEVLNAQNARFVMLVRTADGLEKRMEVQDIVRAFLPNRLGFFGRLGVYFSRGLEFLTGAPREANSEGGVAPAIIGTLVMTLIMCVLVVPFGILAALYLREYAKAGAVVSTVRIAINNLAGVPSIVFGVFGLGFFCYILGAWIDGGPTSPLSSGTWFGYLGILLALLSAGAFATWARMRKPPSARSKRDPLLYILPLIWCAAAVMLITVVALSPWFKGYHRAELPNPTFGKGGLLWASFTLALLTLPVVIVATEEALAAVPGSMREGSYACGASKWQTIRRIVLPRAMPGIMTGVILAMARGAGEVAPLMLVGAVKLAPELPVSLTDWSGSVGPIPTLFVHSERSFMHLGFHIFDLGFQSQNSEAAKPMVFTTTLLLISIVVLLNVLSIWIRGRLRKRFGASGGF